MQNNSLNDFLMSVHYLNHPLFSFLSGLMILLLGIFVLSRDIKSRLFWSFFGMNFALSVWFIGNSVSMYYFNEFNRAFFWWKIAYTLVPFFSLLFYSFYLAYFKKKNKFVPVLCVIGVLEVFLLWFLKDTDNGLYVVHNVGIVFSEITPLAYIFIFSLIKYIVLSAVAFVFFLKEYKIEKNPNEKDKLKLLTAIHFLLIFGAIEWLVVFDIHLHVAWFLIPILFIIEAYAILKHQLLDIKLVVRKAFFYSLIISIISGVIFSAGFLNNWLVARIGGFETWMIPLMSGIAAFVVGNIFWRKSQEVEKLKYEFITVAAHKLRTPLTDIKWAASSLKDPDLSSRDKDKLIKEIVSADERLIDLTNELLSVTKTETSQYNYHFEIDDLERVARKIVNSFQMQMKDRGVKLSYDAEKNLPKVKMDKMRISSVIQTLIENAILYTKNEVKINIDVYKNNVVFHIEDNGIGVSKGDQDNIFSKFYRTREAYLTETEGVGLGLFLAKSIINKHDGKIGVRSEGRGAGSVFWFSLPIA